MLSRGCRPTCTWEIAIIGRVKRTGYIDLHIHGSGRYDTRAGVAEAILKMAEAEGGRGVAAILPAIYAGPVDVMRRHMAAVREAMDLQRITGRGGEATILGVHLEGPFLSPARAGAQPKEHFLRPTAASLERIISGFEDIIRIITLAPELPGALGVIERCAALGMRVNMGHSDATHRQALEGKRAGATGVTHLFNAMRPFHHREPGLAGLGLTDRDLYVEVVADGVHLGPEALKLVFSTKPGDRILLVSDRVVGPQREKGVIRGSAFSVNSGVKTLRDMGIGQRAVERAARINPGRYLGRP